MLKYKIILNPTANQGIGERLVPQITQALQFFELNFDLVITERPWHAAELAKQAVKDRYNVVVAAGGDGTVNEVVNGLMMAKKAGLGSAVLGVLAIGRGNDFAFGAGVPTGWQQSCQTLALNRRHWIDVGCSVGERYPDGRYFVNGVGIGFDAVVGFEAAKMRFLHGFPSYMIAALRTIFVFYKAPLLKIELDERVIEQPSLLVSVMNGKRMGGSFMMAPDGQNDDGLFSLCLARQISRTAILGLIPRFMKGTQAAHSAIQMIKSRRATVTALKGSLPAHADGETLCTEGQKLSIELLPKQIEMVYQPPVSES